MILEIVLLENFKKSILYAIIQSMGKLCFQKLKTSVQEPNLEIVFVELLHQMLQFSGGKLPWKALRNWISGIFK